MTRLTKQAFSNTKRFLNLNALQVYQIIRFSTTLLIGILLAKVFGVATTEIALFEVVLFLGNVVSFFWISAGQKGLLSLFPSYEKKDQGKILFNFFLLLVGLAGLAAVGLWLVQNFLIRQLTQYQEIEFLYLICWYILFNAPAQLIEYIYVLKKQDRPLLQYGGIIHFLQLVAIILPISWGLGIKGIFQFLVAWSILKFIWLLVLINKNGISKIDTSLLKKILLLLVPLSLHTLLGGGMEYVDGFLVTHYFEASDFAIFRYGARELPFVNILIAALAATMIPVAVDNEPEAIVQIKKQVKQLSYWMYPLTLLLMVLSPYLFPLVYNEDFSRSANIFNVYLLIISSRILLPQVFLYSRQHTHILVYSAIVELLINITLSLLFLKTYGLVGIAFATVIAYLINKVILLLYVWKRMDIKLSEYLDWKVYIAFNSLLFLVFWWSLSPTSI